MEFCGTVCFRQRHEHADVKGYYLRDEQRPDATAPDWLQTLWAESDKERSEEESSRGEKQ